MLELCLLGKSVWIPVGGSGRRHSWELGDFTHRMKETEEEVGRGRVFLKLLVSQ